MNTYPRIHNRNILRTSLAVVALGLLTTACGSEGPAETKTGDSQASAVFTDTAKTTVRSGEAQFTNVIDADSTEGARLISGIEITGHQYQHGWVDQDAPTVGTEVTRLEAHVSLSGSRSNYIDNDAGCDTINLDLSGVDPKTAHIDVATISDGSDDTALVSWPKDADGRASDTAIICFAENNEASDGIVVQVSDTVS